MKHSHALERFSKHPEQCTPDKIICGLRHILRIPREHLLFRDATYIGAFNSLGGGSPSVSFHDSVVREEVVDSDDTCSLSNVPKCEALAHKAYLLLKPKEGSGPTMIFLEALMEMIFNSSQYPSPLLNEAERLYTACCICS